MNPVLVCAPDYGFRCGADYEFFFQTGLGVDDDTGAVGVVLEAVVGDHGALFGETFHVLGFAAEIRFGNKKGEIGVLNTGFLEHAVESLLYFLPYSVAVGLDDHTAAHC